MVTLVKNRKITLVRAPLLISFFDVGRQTQQYFNVSSPSSCKENNPIHKSNYKIGLGEVSCFKTRFRGEEVV